jgi:hypothetical protein
MYSVAEYHLERPHEVGLGAKEVTVASSGYLVQQEDPFLKI